MNVHQKPYARHLVLLGGGHSHAILLQMLGMEPLEGVKVTLVSDVSYAPYSGMIPGHIAGFYSYDEVHIDLRRLCQFARADFVLAGARSLDLDKRHLLFDGRSKLGFDVLSVNIGSTPMMRDVPGAQENATAAKPVPDFLKAWEKIAAGIEAFPEKPVNITIVGGGAGGVELSLCMRRRLGPHPKIQLVHQGENLLPSHDHKVGDLFSGLLAAEQVDILLGKKVVAVERGSISLEGSSALPSDHTFWVTSAGAPAWIRNSGLTTDEHGFALVSPTLQSTSHPFVFAAGDIATISGHPRPKSGVFAVRAAKPLAANLRRYLDGRRLLHYRPQKKFLSLIGTAGGSAVASRGKLVWESPAMWYLKDAIDRRFMERFTNLPDMNLSHGEASGEAPDTPAAQMADLERRAQMRCRGCAAKVGSPTLTRMLARLRDDFPDPFVPSGDDIGLNAPDDAAVFTPPPGRRLVQTTDYLPILTDDPFTFARIATLHAFSDIFAMGADPHSLLATVLLPFTSESLIEENAYQVLAGILHELTLMGSRLLGGHTAEAETIALGLTCTGSIATEKLLPKGGARSGDTLILTKALGTGTLFAAEMRLQAKGHWIDTATHSMLTSNQKASQILLDYGASACTDVTGFGLAGHLLEMLRPAGQNASLKIDAIPTLPGARETASQNILSSLHPQNVLAAGALENGSDFSKHPSLPLLFDPQTSGGLIASVPPEKTDDCLKALVEASYKNCAAIGKIVSSTEGDTSLHLE